MALHILTTLQIFKDNPLYVVNNKQRACNQQHSQFRQDSKQYLIQHQQQVENSFFCYDRISRALASSLQSSRATTATNDDMTDAETLEDAYNSEECNIDETYNRA